MGGRFRPIADGQLSRVLQCCILQSSRSTGASLPVHIRQRRQGMATDVLHDGRLGQRLHRSWRPAGQFAKGGMAVGRPGRRCRLVTRYFDRQGERPCIPGRKSHRKAVHYDRHRYRPATASRLCSVAGRTGAGSQPAMKDAPRLPCPPPLAATVICWL